METFLTILLFLAGLSILVFFHELGHFIAAKIFGVYVYEFSLFMGPKLFQFKIGETKYTLRLLPIGGYCSMAGEEDDQSRRNEQELLDEKEKTEVEENVANQEEVLPNVPFERTMLGISNWKKIIIMLAGPLNNVILCFLFLLVFYGTGKSSIVKVADNSIAAQVGLKTDTEVTGYEFKYYVDKYRTQEEAEGMSKEELKKVPQAIIYSSNKIDSFYTLESITHDSITKYMYEDIKGIDENLVNIPSEMNVELTFTDVNETEYKITTKYTLKFNEDKTAFDESSLLKLEDYGISSNGSYGLGTSFKKSFDKEGEMSVLIYQSLGSLITNFKEESKNVSGVVGMYRISKQFTSSFQYFLYFLALISVNLGIMNLLPFPALDGGRIVMTVIEMITRKKCPQKVEGILNGIGFFLLIGLMILVTFKDIFFPIV